MPAWPAPKSIVRRARLTALRPFTLTFTRLLSQSWLADHTHLEHEWDDRRRELVLRPSSTAGTPLAYDSWGRSVRVRIPMSLCPDSMLELFQVGDAWDEPQIVDGALYLPFASRIHLAPGDRAPVGRTTVSLQAKQA